MKRILRITLATMALAALSVPSFAIDRPVKPQSLYCWTNCYPSGCITTCY